MSKFTIVRNTNNGVEILQLEGFLDAHTAPQLESTIAKVIEEQMYRIIVNFEQLDYISSAGLGVFMVFIEDVRSNKGDIKLVSMKPKVYNVFDLLGFPMLFDILPTEDEAKAKFQEAEYDEKNR